MANRHEIYVWEATKADLSKDFDELSENAIVYARQSKTPSKNLLAFAEALNQHQKTVDYSHRFFKEVIYHLQNTTTKAITIEFLEEDDWKRPLRDMVKLAQDHNIIIVDTEITMIFLPTGEIKPFWAIYNWDDLLNELTEADDAILAYKETHLPRTPTAYAIWMRNLLDKELGQYGFRLVKTDVNESVDLHESWYCRDVEIGKQYIHFRHAGEMPNFSSDADSYMICPVVNDIYSKFDFDQKEEIFRKSLWSFTDVKAYSDSQFTENKSINFIKDVINYIIKSIFDKINNIKEIDSFMNGWLIKQPDAYMALQNNNDYIISERKRQNKQFLTADEFDCGDSYTLQRLIIARLANNNQYGRLKKFGEASVFFKYLTNEKTKEWQKFIHYLEEEINPETFWQQYTLAKAEEKRLEENRIQQLTTQFNLNPEQEVIPVSDQWYDAKENLIWQRCCVGEHWLNGQIAGGKKLFNESEVQSLLAQLKDTGWRLPTYQELAMLSFNKVFIKKVSYITKEGFDYYESIESRFLKHWISPFMKMCIVTISENAQLYSSYSIDDKNPQGYVRLVRTAS